MKIKYTGDNWDLFGKAFDVVEETERTFVVWNDLTQTYSCRGVNMVVSKNDCEIIEE